MSDLGKNWDSNPEFTSWAVRNKLPMDAANIKGTLDAFVNSKIGAAPQAPQGRTLSDLAKSNGPIVYDEAAVQPQQAVASTPIASQNPAARLIGSQSSSQHSSMRGNPAFFAQGSGLLKEEMDAIDSLSGKWDSNQRAMARELAFADTIPDEGKRNAAKQYISNKYGRQLAPYDNGVDKPNVSMSEGSASRRWQGNGAGNTDPETGFMLVNGDWQPVIQLQKAQPAVRSLVALLSLRNGVNDKAGIVSAANKIYEMANAGDEKAKAILKIANSETGRKLGTTKLYSSKEASMNAADPSKGAGIMVGDETIGDLGSALSYIEGAQRYEGPTQTYWFSPDLVHGQYISAEKAASLSGEARKKKPLSSISK